MKLLRKTPTGLALCSYPAKRLVGALTIGLGLFLVAVFILAAYASGKSLLGAWWLWIFPGILLLLGRLQWTSVHVSNFDVLRRTLTYRDTSIPFNEIDGLVLKQQIRHNETVGDYREWDLQFRWSKHDENLLLATNGSREVMRAVADQLAQQLLLRVKETDEQE